MLQTRRDILKFGLANLTGALADCGGSSYAATGAPPPGTPNPAASPPAAPSAPAPPPPPPPPAVARGKWQQLAFPAILRVPVGVPSAGSSATTFDPAPAIRVDGAAPVSSNVVPFRGFCRTIMGEPGVLYYHGSLHSDYAGNEIDRIDLRDVGSTTMGLGINHQPTVPPGGRDSGYGAGGSAYIYRMYGKALSDPAAQWQPYAAHNWTFDSWHPAYGYLQLNAYAVGNGSVLGPNPAGAGSYVQSSALYGPYATHGDPRRRGFVYYDYADSRYKLAFVQPGPTQTMLPAGVSDYAAYRQSLLAFYCDSYTLSIYEHADGAWALHDSQRVASFSGGITNNTWYQGKDGNGLLVQHMDENRFLLYTTNGAAWGSVATTLDRVNFLHQIYVYDAEAKRMTRVLLGANIVGALDGYLPNGDGLLSFAVDRSDRRVYAVAIDGPNNDGMSTGPLRVWESGFDDLASWAEVTFTSAARVSGNFAIDRHPLKVYNGFLYFASKAGDGIRVDRVKVAGSGVAPRFDFHRQDYAAQNFKLSAPIGGGVLVSKHTNLAYRSGDGRYHQMGGDIVDSFTQSAYSVGVSPGGYEFRQELDELTPAPAGHVRPASVDDGAWVYCGASNPNPALADRFIYARGGDGIGYRSNRHMQGKYADDAAAIADRWVLSKFVIYDPSSRRFSDVDITSWPVDQGRGTVPHPSTWPAAWCRNGVFDPSRNTFFRFASDSLVAFNFDTQRIRVWTIAWWQRSATVKVRLDDVVPSPGTRLVDDETWPDMYLWDAAAARYRTQASFSWEHQALWLDEATGRLYVVAPATGYLWCFETRGAEMAGGEGLLSIPFGPLGKRMPFTGMFPSPAPWDMKMHSYLVPFKGGLFYTCDTAGGNSGTARYAYWRRLGDAGEWTPITLPPDWAANSFAARYPGSANNDEILAMAAYPMGRGGLSRPRSFYLVR